MKDVALDVPDEHEAGKKVPAKTGIPHPASARGFYKRIQSHHPFLTKPQREAMKETTKEDYEINQPRSWLMKAFGILFRLKPDGQTEVLDQPETTNQLRARKRREKRNESTN